VKGVGVLSDVSAALRMISETGLDLVLVDASLSDEGALAVLKQIGASGSRTKCLVLADDREQWQGALVAGADVALLKGCRATDLFDAIERLLLPPDI